MERTHLMENFITSFFRNNSQQKQYRSLNDYEKFIEKYFSSLIVQPGIPQKLFKNILKNTQPRCVLNTFQSPAPISIQPKNVGDKPEKM